MQTPQPNAAMIFEQTIQKTVRDAANSNVNPAIIQAVLFSNCVNITLSMNEMSKQMDNQNRNTPGN